MDENEALLALNERRAARALDKAPALVSHIRSLVIPAGAGAQDGTPRAPKADPPLPFRADAMDDADSLFATLVDWSETWLRVMPVIPCEVRPWRIRYGEDASGMPANVTAAGSYVITDLVCRWLLRHHTIIRRAEGDR